jgi:hypothetical protein|tara:strand:- start:60 stop:242 length:183 start_codon:yes stop_codon:yes gene_type:complete
MVIFDCFQYFDEKHMANLRFNILNEFVDYSLIINNNEIDVFFEKLDNVLTKGAILKSKIK